MIQNSESIGLRQETEVGIASAATGCEECLVTSCSRTETVYHTLKISDGKKPVF